MQTRKPHRVVNTIEEFREEKVGTVKGTSMVEIIAAAEVPAERVDDSIPTGMLPAALKSGKVTAVVLGIENGISARRADPDIEIGMFVGPPSSLAYGVRKSDTAPARRARRVHRRRPQDAHVESARRQVLRRRRPRDPAGRVRGEAVR